MRPVEGDGADGSRCVGPDTGEPDQAFVGVWQRAAVVLDDGTRGAVQVAGSRVVAETLPRLENILLIQELSNGRDEARARELLALVGLEPEVNRFPAEISGGSSRGLQSLAVWPNGPTYYSVTN